MNKIILKEQQQLKSIQEIFDEAEVGQAFSIEYEGLISIAIKVRHDDNDVYFLVGLLYGYIFVEFEYITSLKPINIEIREL